RLLDSRSRQLVAEIAEADLFRKPRIVPNSMAMFSCGEYIVRSAAVVEKTFGGITTRLWDDPFEWTLPEKLENKDGVLRYFDDVESTRQTGFSFLASDGDLDRQIPAPERLRRL
ncbi:MAG: hypothetical protein ABR530_09900, partial [Pyrinomonadaceae bacterium]